MVVAAAVVAAALVAAAAEVAVAEDSAAVTVEAAVEVDSEAAVVVAVAVPCVEAVEADTETVPTKHPTTNMLQENSTKQYSRSHAPPSQELLQSCHAPTNNIQEEAKPRFFNLPRFFSAAVEMSDQYFITSKVILGLAETITKIVCFDLLQY